MQMIYIKANVGYYIVSILIKLNYGTPQSDELIQYNQTKNVFLINPTYIFIISICHGHDCHTDVNSHPVDQYHSNEQQRRLEMPNTEH